MPWMSTSPIYGTTAHHLIDCSFPSPHIWDLRGRSSIIQMESSPFLSLSHTSYAPTESERQQIKDLCIQPLQELSAIEAQIEALQKRRNELKALIDVHLMLLAPIRRIPPEVLEHIFILCLPHDRNPVMHGSEAPWLLTSICRDWRKLAIETTRLWNRIHINIPNVGDGPSAQRLNHNCLLMVKQWLARSGLHLPLSISLSSNVASRTSTSPPMAPLYGAAIIKYVNRWKDIELNFPPWFLDCFHRLSSKDVPMISKFRLSSGTDLSWVHDIRRDGELNFLQSSRTTSLHLENPLHHPIFTRLIGSNLRDLSLNIADLRMSNDPDSYTWTLPGILS